MDASADEVMDIAQEGHRAYERGDYDEARRLFRIAADQGDPRAQSWLGFMYEEGLGVEKSDAEAYRWYRKAAGQGDARAKRKLQSSVEKLRELGIKYEFGHGVEQNTLKARYFYELAASQGDTYSQDALRQGCRPFRR